MLRVLRRPLCREPLLWRRHRDRRAQGQRSAAAIVELGAVPALGKRQVHRSVAALFFRQPVLTKSFRGDAKHRTPGISRFRVRFAPRNDGLTVVLHFAAKPLVSAALETVYVRN